MKSMNKSQVLRSIFTFADPNPFATYAFRKVSSASLFLPIDKSNFGLSGKHETATNAMALAQLLIKIYIRHGRISISPKKENSQSRGIMNSPISAW